MTVRSFGHNFPFISQKKELNHEFDMPRDDINDADFPHNHG